MEHDKKLKSVDDFLPAGHDEPSRETDDAEKNQEPPMGLEPNFGMPSFDFFVEPKASYSNRFEPPHKKQSNDSASHSVDTHSSDTFTSDTYGSDTYASDTYGADAHSSETKVSDTHTSDKLFDEYDDARDDYRDNHSDDFLASHNDDFLSDQSNKHSDYHSDDFDKNDFEDQQTNKWSAQNDRELPLNDDTGWQSNTAIGNNETEQHTEENFEQPITFDALGFLGADTTASGDADSRFENTVTPFPGNFRQPEPTSEILRGHEEEFGEGQQLSDDYDDRDDHDDVDDQDQLADAVQSALRNIYGANAQQQWDDDDEVAEGEVSVANELIGSNARIGDVMWQDNHASNNAYADDDHDGDTEANTEAVLEYLYGSRRPEPSETLTLDTALRDINPDIVGMEPQWQDSDDYDDRHHHQNSFSNQPPFPNMPNMHDHAPVFQGGHALEPRYPEPTHSGHADWQPPAYMSNLPAPAGHMYPGMQHDPRYGRTDSGHLLGAAGLGLVGGIALAGVLAVFVFHSIVDVKDPNVGNNETKISERIVPGNTLQREARLMQGGAAAVVLQPNTPQSVDPSLNVRGVVGGDGEPIRLNIALANAEQAEEALVSIKGLPKDSRLSTGIDVGGGQWLLPPNKLRNLTLTVPSGTYGNFGLSAQLLKDDAQTSLSEPVYFTLNVGQARAQASQLQPETALTTGPIQEPVRPETDFLTQMLIRDGNKAMREGDIAAARRLYEQAAMNGNAEAALAMGRSFDPSYFEKLNVKTGKPDPLMAFQWYKKALDGGLTTARIKIDNLNQWMQK